MTREEAAKLLDIVKVFDGPRLSEAIRMAKTALREQGGGFQNGNNHNTVKDWPSYMDFPRERDVTDINVGNKWISVEDRLPEEWKEPAGDLINYLIFIPEYGVDVGNYAKPVKTWLCVGMPCKVTHWMPLPEPPTEEEV